MLKKIRGRLAALALVGVLLGGVGVAASTVVEPAVVDTAASVGIDLPTSAQSAEAASAFPRVSCTDPRWPNVSINNFGRANVNVQVWNYSGTTYLASFGSSASTIWWTYYGARSVQFRIYSAGGFGYTVSCQR